jgi:hypothetical protein
MNKNKTIPNRPLPNPGLAYIVNFWRDGGNFNKGLYDRVCQIKTNQKWTEQKDKSKD